ncbi:MAG: zinc ribbon domain-containing protein, partial [Promethearchaeota archaeon]
MKFEKKDKNAFGADWLNANINSIITGKSTLAIQKQINQYITLKLMSGRTYIYVNGRMFIQCIRLILNIPKSEVHLYDEVDSIDEAAKLYSKHVFQNRIVQGPMAAPVPNQTHDITPEQEFWGHCSNIQAWVEHDYDTRILMSNIAFPLLRELTKAGDPLANKVFKEEIALRLESGYPSVVQYLLNQGYLRYFTASEFKTIIETTELIKGLSSNPKMLSRFLIECGTKFPTLIKDILLKVLRLPEGKKVILSSMSTSESPKMFLMRASLRANPRYLLILKNALENLFHQVDQKTGEDIIDCIQEINNHLEGREVHLPNLLGEMSKRYEAIKKWYLDGKVFQNIQDKRDLLILKKLMNEISLPQSRCSYCGKIIPKGQEICEWCGHKRDDDEGGFFPYQR